MALARARRHGARSLRSIQALPDARLGKRHGLLHSLSAALCGALVGFYLGLIGGSLVFIVAGYMLYRNSAVLGL
jgi:hypothetical protein